MTESERLAIIANAVAQGDNKLDPRLANYMEDLKAEKLAEDLVIEHGLLEANQNDVEDEFVSLDAVEAEEDDDFDNDENLVDMNCVSGSMREIFEDC
jgi:hypothetical protein|tara:strand:+ start:703 stop:993 length:291 start_codon:yes stop_codon:yes gene_type:complete